MTGINGLRDLHRQEGFIAPLPEGVMEFGGKMFEISKDGTEGRISSPNPIDVKRTVDAIREAKMTCEAVLVMVHSHEIRKDNDEEADYFLEEFAHAWHRCGRQRGDRGRNASAEGNRTVS